jgi:hypothetical protein
MNMFIVTFIEFKTHLGGIYWQIFTVLWDGVYVPKEMPLSSELLIQELVKPSLSAGSSRYILYYRIFYRIF